MQRHHPRSRMTVMAAALVLAACGLHPTPLPIVPGGSASPLPTVTPSPSVDPTMEPRIEGTYAVVKKVTRKRNFKGIEVGDVFHRTYQVTPSCPVGPCGGSIKIELAEAKGTIRRKLSYDESTRTYRLVPVASPVICTGVNGKRYRINDTTDTITITPVETTPTGIDMITTRWTGVEVVKALPDGPALHQGHCRIAVLNYAYTGTLE